MATTIPGTYNRPALQPHVIRAISDLMDQTETPTLDDLALTAWQAEAERASSIAAGELTRRLRKALGVEVPDADPAFFTRLRPRECAGVMVEGRLFGFRQERDWIGRRQGEHSPSLIAATCSAKGCENELTYAVSGIVELGRAYAFAIADGAGPDWKCNNHRKQKGIAEA